MKLPTVDFRTRTALPFERINASFSAMSAAPSLYRNDRHKYIILEHRSRIDTHIHIQYCCVCLLRYLI